MNCGDASRDSNRVGWPKAVAKLYDMCRSSKSSLTSWSRSRSVPCMFSASACDISHSSSAPDSRILRFSSGVRRESLSTAVGAAKHSAGLITAASTALIFLGFQQSYLHGRAFPNRPLMPAIRTVLIAHGIALSLWVMLLLLQPLLVVNHKYRVHMMVGRVGAVLATLTVISAATDRTSAIVPLFERTVWRMTFGPFFPPLVVGALLLIVKSTLTRSSDRYFAAG